jgi:hypothetical protein
MAAAETEGANWLATRKYCGEWMSGERPPHVLTRN